MFDGLPAMAYVKHPVTEKTVVILRGDNGYNGYKMAVTQGDPDEMNERLLKVTKAQSAAMMTGSMFGWHVPGANPAAYDENGVFIGVDKEWKLK